MKLFLKSIIIGIGGIAPGLSGSVLMIIFGIYQDALDALGTLFTDFKRKIKFLLPIGAGIITGLLLFSKLLDYLLQTFPMPTRFTFLGLIAGTIPLFYRQMTKKGYSKKYFLYIALAFAAGLLLFTFNRTTFPQISNPNLLEKIMLGIAVAASSIVPGADSVVLLSTLGLYELYVAVLAHPLDHLNVLLPMIIGVAVGGISVSFLMSQLFKRFYTATYSIIFGVFLSVIPNMLTKDCVPAMNWQTVISFVLMIGGFFLSFYLGRMEGMKKTEKEST